MALSMEEAREISARAAGLRAQCAQLLERVDRLEAVRRSDLTGRADDVASGRRGETVEIRDAVSAARAAVDAIAVDVQVDTCGDGYFTGDGSYDQADDDYTADAADADAAYADALAV